MHIRGPSVHELIDRTVETGKRVSSIDQPG
jgi:hypothetical protein